MILTVTDPLAIAPEDPVVGDITNKGVTIPCNSSGVTTAEQSVDTTVILRRGNESMTLNAITPTINGTYIGPYYVRPSQSVSPANYFRVTKNLSTGKMTIYVNTGTDLSEPWVMNVIVTGTIDGETTTRQLDVTITGAKKGADGVNYDIVFSEAWASADSDNVIAAKLAGTAYRITGATRTAIANATIRIGYILDDDDTYAEFSAAADGTFDDSHWFDGDIMGGECNKGSKIIFAAIIEGGVNVVCVKTVDIHEYVQRMYYPAGIYSATTTYTRTKKACPLVLYEASNGTREYWFLDADSSVGVAPADTQGNPWKKATNYQMVITEALFAPFAKLGSFVIIGDYFISQYGTLYSANTTATPNTVKIDSSNVNTLFYGDGTFIGTGSGALAYTYFDSEDPMVETRPATNNLKFRPALVMNAKTGAEYKAHGNVRISEDGDVTMNNATIKGSLMFRKVVTKIKTSSEVTTSPEEVQDLLTMYATNGSVIAEGDWDNTVPATKLTLNHDTCVIGGAQRSCYVYLPPASAFKGATIRIINGTYSGGNGSAIASALSTITLIVAAHEGIEVVDDDAHGYVKNGLATSIPFEIIHGTGNTRTDIIGAPDSTKTCSATYGNRGLKFDKYREVELVSMPNSYAVDPTNYAWMIVGAKE